MSSIEIDRRSLESDRPSLEADRRPGPTFYRLLLRELAGPTLFTFLVLSIVVMTEDLLGFSHLVMNRGLDAGSVAGTVLYRLIPAMEQILPFAILVGSLVALGRLGGDHELLALEASGVSSRRLLAPLLVFASFVAALGLVLAIYVSPWANRALDASLAALAREKPWSAIEAGSVERFGDWKLRARETSPDGSQLSGVQLWLPDIGETVFAQRATLGPGPGGNIQLDLQDGALLLSPEREPRRMLFDQLTVWMPTSKVRISRETSERLAGFTVQELLTHERWDYRSEAWRRFATPVSSLLMGALALPLFLSGARFSRSISWLLGVGSTLVYYGLVQLGSGLIANDTVSPVVGVWLPNMVFAGLLFGLLGRRTGGMSTFGGGLARPRKRQPKRRVPKPSRSTAMRLRRFALPYSIAAQFFEIAALGFAALLLGYVILDLFERADHYASYGASFGALLRYYAARIPLLASRVVPMALLVATALTVARLAERGELVAMRSCGVPAIRGLAPVLVLCAIAVPLSFALDDALIPRVHAYMDYVLDVQIKGWDVRSRHVEVWYGDGTHFYEADLFDPGGGVAEQLTVYELDQQGLPIARSHATHGRHVGGGTWRMTDHVRVEAREGAVVRVRAEPFAPLGFAEPQQTVDTRHLSTTQLLREIGELEQNGVDTRAYRVDLYLKLVKPFACFVLPALALFFALGGPPHPSVAATLVFAAMVAAGYALLSGFGASLGYADTVPAAVAAIAPLGAFGAATAALGLRLSVFR